MWLYWDLSKCSHTGFSRPVACKERKIVDLCFSQSMKGHCPRDCLITDYLHLLAKRSYVAEQDRSLKNPVFPCSTLVCSGLSFNSESHAYSVS